MRPGRYVARRWHVNKCETPALDHYTFGTHDIGNNNINDDHDTKTIFTTHTKTTHIIISSSCAGLRAKLVCCIIRSRGLCLQETTTATTTTRRPDHLCRFVIFEAALHLALPRGPCDCDCWQPPRTTNASSIRAVNNLAK